MLQTRYYSSLMYNMSIFRLEKSDENRLLFPFSIANRLFAKTSTMENFDNRNKIEFRIDHFFELGNHFDLIRGGNIASKYRFLMMFKIFFADFEHFGDPIFAHFAKFISDVVK